MERLSLFATLPDGWYQDAIGKCVSSTTLEYTTRLLKKMCDDLTTNTTTPEPSLVATYGGGIGIIWRRGDDILVDIAICEAECSIWEPIYCHDDTDDDFDIYDMKTEFDELCAYVRNRLTE